MDAGPHGSDGTAPPQVAKNRPVQEPRQPSVGAALVVYASRISLREMGVRIPGCSSGGQDEAAFVSGELHKKKFKIIHCEEVKVVSGKSLPKLRDFSLVLHDQFNYKRIFNDDTGIGGGLTDILQEALGKSRVVALNNASKRVFDSDGERRKGILKEDLYSNALRMMEKGEVEIIDNLKLLRSLKSIQFEYTKDRNLRIHGKYTHLAEAFVRCCWAMQSKGLKLFVA